MTPDEIIKRLTELRVPHAAIAQVLGRERSAATKLLSGKRKMALAEVKPLEALVKRYAKYEVVLQDPDPFAMPFDLNWTRAGLPVRGTVQAGAWLEVDPQDQPRIEIYPAAPDPRYPTKAQWISRVSGDSMNALVRRGQPAGILDGDLVHVVDAIAIDYRFRDGDVVEVERSRFQGREREITLKQVEIRSDGSIVLWPRSSNPRWSEPVVYADGDIEDVEVRVLAKVIQHIRTF